MNKAVICAIVFAVMFVCASTTARAQDGGTCKIDICHFDKDAGVFELITVGACAVAKHLENHGDLLYEVFVSSNDDPIWSNDQAQSGECANRCAADGGIFTGQWWTTVPGLHSVCQCATC